MATTKKKPIPIPTGERKPAPPTTVTRTLKKAPAVTRALQRKTASTPVVRTLKQASNSQIKSKATPKSTPGLELKKK
jgi:hypothetical protein